MAASTKFYGAMQNIGLNTVISDNAAVALSIQDTAGEDYIKIVTTDTSESLSLYAGQDVSSVEGIRVVEVNANAELLLCDEVGFIEDPDCMMRRRGANNLEFRMGGADILGIDQNGAYVETGKFGVGTLTPTAHSEVVGFLATALTSGTVASPSPGTPSTTLTGSSTVFTTDFHVGAAIKVGTVTTTVTVIASNTSLTLEDSLDTGATGTTCKRDGGELFAVKTGDSQTLLAVNGSGAVTCGSNPGDEVNGNISIGDVDALDDITTGIANVIIGHAQNNYLLSTGHSNVAAGMKALDKATTAHSCVAVGHAALTDLQTGSQNTAVGHSALVSINTGSSNTALGVSAGSGITGGADCVLIGKEANVTTSGSAANQIAIGKGATAHGDNRATIGNASVISIEPHSNVTCNLGHSSYEYDDVICVAVVESSDERLKENITDTSMGLSFINALRPVSYKFKDIEHQTEMVGFPATRTVINDDGEEVEESFTEERETLVHPGKVHTRHHQGLIAQEVKAVLDDMGIDAVDFGGFVDANVSGGADKMALRYRQFIGPLIKAVQELTARITELEAGD